MAGQAAVLSRQLDRTRDLIASPPLNTGERDDFYRRAIGFERQPERFYRDALVACLVQLENALHARFAQIPLCFEGALRGSTRGHEPYVDECLGGEVSGHIPRKLHGPIERQRPRELAPYPV